MLASRQTRTWFQILQLNGTTKQLVEIVEFLSKLNTHKNRISTEPPQGLFQAHGCYCEKKEAKTEKPDTQDLAALAQAMALKIAIDFNQLTDDFIRALGLDHTASEIKSIELNKNEITVIDGEAEDIGESQRVEAYYKPPSQGERRVWIEWKYYQPKPSGEPNTKERECVEALAARLKENNPTNQFRVPHCLGYFRDIDQMGEDRCRFGLVFEKPPGVQPSTQPISLLDLLRDSSTRVEIPSLTDRIKLALRIAECIERLHAVNWLHKGLRSSNILFFSNMVADIDFGSLYISGFDYTYPDRNDKTIKRSLEHAALDLYRHPAVQGNAGCKMEPASGFKKSYDIYSLGVEIAYWKPIDEVLGILNPAKVPPSTTIQVRRLLLDEKEGYLKHVRSHLGNTVHGVVKACLEGPPAFGLETGANETQEEVGAKLQEQFYEKVVRRLKNMRV